MTKNKQKQAKPKPKGSGGQSAKPRFVLDVKPFSIGPVESKGFHAASGRSAPMSNDSQQRVVSGKLEPLSVVESSVDLTIYSFLVQPGLEGIFPRGFEESKGFQNYRFRHLKMRYTPDVSVFADEGKRGTVYLGYTPNPGSEVPATDTDLQLLPAAMKKIASEGFTLDCAKVLNKDHLNIRRGVLPGNLSIADCDAGIMYIGVKGSPADSVEMGTVELFYELDVWNKVAGSGEQAGINTSCATLSSPDATLTTATTTVAQLVPVSNGIGAEVASGIVQLLPGHYQLYAESQVSTTGAMTSNKLSLYKDGVELKAATNTPSATAGNTMAAESMTLLWPVTVVGGDAPTKISVRLTVVATGTITGTASLFVRTC